MEESHATELLEIFQDAQMFEAEEDMEQASLVRWSFLDYYSFFIKLRPLMHTVASWKLHRASQHQSRSTKMTGLCRSRNIRQAPSSFQWH